MMMNQEEPTGNYLRALFDGFGGDVFFSREALNSVGRASGQSADGELSSYVLVESVYFSDGQPVYIGNQWGGFADASELAEHAFAMVWAWQHDPSESLKPLIRMLNEMRKERSGTVSISGELFQVTYYECQMGIVQVFIDRKGAGHCAYGVELDQLELIDIDQRP